MTRIDFNQVKALAETDSALRVYSLSALSRYIALSFAAAPAEAVFWWSELDTETKDEARAALASLAYELMSESMAEKRVTIARHTASSGVNGGGSYSGAWAVRALNVAEGDAHTALVDGAVEMAEGRWMVTAVAQHLAPTGAAMNARIAIVKNKSVYMHGLNHRVAAADGRDLYAAGIVETAEGDTLEVYYYVTGARTSVGLGQAVSTGQSEVYATMSIVEL